MEGSYDQDNSKQVLSKIAIYFAFWNCVESDNSGKDPVFKEFIVMWEN